MDELNNVVEETMENMEDVAEETTDIVADGVTDAVSDALENVPSNGEAVAGIAIGVSVCIAAYELGKRVVVPAAGKAFNWGKTKISELRAKKKPVNEEDVVDVDYEEVEEDVEAKKSKK